MSPIASLALGQIGLVVAMFVLTMRVSDLEKRAGRGKK